MKKRQTSILEKYLVVLSPRLQTHTPVTSLMSSSGVYYSWQVLYMKISHQSHIEQYTKKESIQQVCQYLRVERPSGKDE